MSSPPSDPPAALRWLRARPVWFALAVAVVMVLAGLAIFDDLTLVIVGGATSAVLTYLAWRPGGFGWRLDDGQRRLLEERGDLSVRPAWLLQSALIVLGAVLALLLVALVVS